ncbi:hypothetical protein TNCT_364081 [Trichonephila clavata]|uniref:Uncharacterized protein n=1 Tax=Trichonephila clavata TaxID=2740835 RepID=A0A8X6I6S1_TRICU|nr:hypothetical protein TNCT_364081 [Trichonephila clavata]
MELICDEEKRQSTKGNSDLRRFGVSGLIKGPRRLEAQVDAEGSIASSCMGRGINFYKAITRYLGSVNRQCRGKEKLKKKDLYSEARSWRRDHLSRVTIGDA